MKWRLPLGVESILPNYGRVVVGGIITDSANRILFLKRAPHESLPNLWEIPSGGQERGESLLDTLGREIREETGLMLVEVERFVSSVEYKTERNSCIQLTFLVKCEGILTLSSEHCEAQWCTLEEFRSNLDMFMLRVMGLSEY